MLENALLHLFQAIMIAVENAFSAAKVIFETFALAPGQRQDPVQIIANNGRLGGHRAHLAQLLELRLSFRAGFLGQLGLGQTLFQLGHLLAAVIALTSSRWIAFICSLR